MGIASFYVKMQNMQQEGRQILGEKTELGRLDMKEQGARSKIKIRQGREGDITGDETMKTRMSALFSWICMSKGSCCLQFSCFPDLVSSLKMADHCPTLQQSKSCILLNSEPTSRRFNIPIMFHDPTTERLSVPLCEDFPCRGRASSVKDTDRSYFPAHDRFYLEIARVRMSF